MQHFTPVVERLGNEFELDSQLHYENAILALHRSHCKGAIESMALVHCISD